MAHRFSCSTACGILPDQGWNTWLLHGKAYSLPLNHQYHRATRKASLLIFGFQFKACFQHLLKIFSPFTNVKFSWGGVEDSKILLYFCCCCFFFFKSNIWVFNFNYFLCPQDSTHPNLSAYTKQSTRLLGSPLGESLANI